MSHSVVDETPAQLIKRLLLLSVYYDNFHLKLHTERLLDFFRCKGHYRFISVCVYVSSYISARLCMRGFTSLNVYLHYILKPEETPLNVQTNFNLLH